MHPKFSPTQNLFVAKSWRPCLQLLMVLAILCWGSLARAQQSVTWMGTNSAVAAPYSWTNTLNWVDNSSAVNERPSTNGDSLTFGGVGTTLVPAAGKNPTNNFASNPSVTVTNSITIGTNTTIVPGPLPTGSTNYTYFTNIVTTTYTSTFGIGSITFTTNGFILGGNALQITNGITDGAGASSNSIIMTLGKSQTFQNNSAVGYTNTVSGGLNLSTNTLTLGGSAPIFLTSIVSSTNGGVLIVNNSSYVRLAVTNSYGTNLSGVIPNYMPYSTNYTFATNYVVLATNVVVGVSTNVVYSSTNIVTTTNFVNTLPVTNSITIYTNAYAVVGFGGFTNYYYITNAAVSTFSNIFFVTNVFGPLNPDALIVQAGGVAQLNPVVIGGNGGLELLPNGPGVGNISVDGTLDLNGMNPTMNGLEDSAAFGGSGNDGVVDNINFTNIGIYTLTVGNWNSNAVYTGTIKNSFGTVGLTKIGWGTETLASGNSYSGQTAVNQGTLVVGAGGSLGNNSLNLVIASGAVLDVSQKNPYGGYLPAGPLTVAAGTPTKPYTNFLNSYDPSYGTNFTVTLGTNYFLTYWTNTDLATYTNVLVTSNFVALTYTTNSIISVINADVVGNFNVAGGGAISPITSVSPGIATWTINGSLTIDNSLGLGAPNNLNRVNFLLNNTTTAGGGTNDLIAVNGPLAIGDELDVVVTPLTGSLSSNGKYTLFTSAGYTAISPNNGHAANIQVVTPRGLTNQITSDANNIYLAAGGTASPGSIIWAGTPALNNWNVHLSQNWKNGGSPDYFYALDNVTFNDTGVGSIVMPVVLNPGSMTFNNSLTNYTFTQNQSTFITGTGGLVKNGSGTVTLQNPNSFTGDVTVNGGTLALGFYNTSDAFQHLLYHGVPAGNLILGGGTINLNEQINTSPEADFQNLTINPGASAMTQSPRTASSTPIYVISNNVYRAVGGALNIIFDTTTSTGDNGGRCGIFFVNTNAQGYYGVNGILGGYATMALSDWVNARNAVNGSINYTNYQFDPNPANWNSVSNVSLSSVPSGNVNTETINSLKLNPTANYAVNINPANTLTLSSGGLLVPTVVAPYQVAITGGTLLGAPSADLILLNHNSSLGSSLLISSVIADNGGATGLTSAGGGTTILTGQNTYTGPTYIDNGFSGAAPGTLQVGANGTSGSIASSSAIYDNGNLAFNRSDNISFGGVISGTGNLKKLSAGALTLAANNTLSGLVTISAGTLQLGAGGAAGSVSNTTSLVDNGTLAFDNNNTVGYPHPITGYGNLVQFGTGNLILTNTETYSGNTIVSNGTVTLTVSGSIANTATITVNSGAVLDVSAVSGGLTLRSAAPSEVLQGNGTINGSVTTAAGTTLDVLPGISGFGTLTINNALNLSGGNYKFDISNSGHDTINVGGALAESSGTVVLSVSGSLSAGVYPLIHTTAGGLSVGLVNSLGLFGFVQPGSIAVLSNSTPNDLTLLVYPGNIPSVAFVGNNPAFPGGVNNNWDAATANWTNLLGGPLTTYANPDYALIDETWGSTNPAISLLIGVSSTAITVNSTNLNYAITGTGANKITGGASLTKNGAGQLALQTVNDYLGGTTISGGTVQLGNNTVSTSDGTVGGNGAIGISNNATLVVNNFATETISGPISGAGQVVQKGAGTLVLAGNNLGYSGGISNGTVLQMGNGFTGTLGNGNVTNNQSLLFNVGPTPASVVNVPANISGTGGITNIGTGIATLSGSNTFSGSVLLNSGTIRLGSANAMLGTAGIYMDNASNAVPVGTLDLNGYNLKVPFVQNTINGFNHGNGMPNPVVPVILNNGTGTSTLTFGSGLLFTNVAELLDNNNGGTGKLALLVTNGTFVYLFSAWNNLLALNYPNLFSGGLTISNATVVLGQNGGGSGAPNSGIGIGGTGIITLLGGHGSVTNGLFGMPTNGTLYAVNFTGSQSGTVGTTVGTVNIPTGEFGTIGGPARGTFTFGLSGGGTVLLATTFIRGQWNITDAGFTGTVILSAPTSNGGGGAFPLNNTVGFPNAIVWPVTNNITTMNVCGTVGGNVLQFGALAGGDSSSQFNGGSNPTSEGSANTIYAIGNLNQSTTNGSQFADGGVGLRKVGTGTLTLTNNNMTFGGQLVVSNGTLAFAPLGTNVFNYPSTASYLNGTNITIVSPGILDVTAAGAPATLYLSHNAAQTLFGNGTLNGSLVASNGIIAPGRRASDAGTYPGKMTVNGTATVNFGSTFLMAINSTTTPVYDSFVTATPANLTINSAALIVNNAGPAAFPGGTSNVFRFFNIAVPVNIGGGSGITNITLPALTPGEHYVTNLVLDGSIALVNTNSALNAYPPSIQSTVSGSTLTLGWPTNLGWVLQAQTNGLSVGLTPTNNWVDVPGSTTATQQVITINQTNPAVFYRMRNPSAPVQ